MTEAAPPVYCNLTGKFGLATMDPAWEALTQPGASAGLGLVTNGAMASKRQIPELLSRRRGLLRLREHGRQENGRAAGPDVVCFRSAPANADGYHCSFRTSTAPVLDAAARDGDAREGAAAGRVGGQRPQGAAAALYGARVVQVRARPGRCGL